jgi:hypothetical protein
MCGVKLELSMTQDKNTVGTVEQVKRYFAYWFQVGKPVILPVGDRRMLPDPGVSGDRYSDSFEACWAELLQPKNQDAYLEGTKHTLKELLSDRWDILSCARCTMPVPIDTIGLDVGCPCSDLSNWPDVNIPTPHDPVSTRNQLGSINQRLQDRLANLK